MWVMVADLVKAFDTSKHVLMIKIFEEIRLPKEVVLCDKENV